MRTYCEVVISDFMPAIKAMIARNLLDKHGMTQADIAKRMKTTQPAISYYKREMRGAKVKFLQKNKKVNEFIEDVSSRVSSGTIRFIDISVLCKLLREEKFMDENSEVCNFCTCKK